MNLHWCCISKKNKMILILIVLTQIYAKDIIKNFNLFSLKDFFDYFYYYLSCYLFYESKYFQN